MLCCEGEIIDIPWCWTLRGYTRRFGEKRNRPRRGDPSWWLRADARRSGEGRREVVLRRSRAIGKKGGGTIYFTFYPFFTLNKIFKFFPVKKTRYQRERETKDPCTTTTTTGLCHHSAGCVSTKRSVRRTSIAIVKSCSRLVLVVATSLLQCIGPGKSLDPPGSKEKCVVARIVRRLGSRPIAKKKTSPRRVW